MFSVACGFEGGGGLFYRMETRTTDLETRVNRKYLKKQNECLSPLISITIAQCGLVSFVNLENNSNQVAK